MKRMIKASLLSDFTRYHEDADNYHSNPEGFDAMYDILNQYGSDEGAQDWKKIRVSIKKKFPQCSSCRFDPICEGPWNEYAEAYGGDEFSPVPGEKVHDAREILTGRFRDQFPLAFEVLP